jgi:hypothetical protein
MTQIQISPSMSINFSSNQTVGVLDHAIIFMAKWYLLIDALNGFMLSQLGQGLPLSIGYKSILLALMLASLLQQRHANLWFIPVSIVLLLLGPFYSLVLTGATAGFSYDVSMVLKLLSPVIAAMYFYYLSLRAPQYAWSSLHQVLHLAFLIVLANLLIGQFGYGFTAYQPNDYLPDQNLGTKGFFKATNELSALLLVLSGYLFAYYWPRHKVKFSVALICCIFCGKALLTKTGLAGVVLLAVIIPLLQSFATWQRFSRFIKIALIVAIVFGILLLWQLPLLLDVLPLSEKLRFTYQQQGLIGLLLSSRDLFVIENWRLSELYFSDWHQLLGVGYTAMDLYSGKPLTEIDPADLTLWFGLPGLLWFGWFFLGNLRMAWLTWRQQPVGLAAGILAINAVLLLVASMAGHVLTSGMLWVPWGMLNGALLLSLHVQESRHEA